MKYDWNSQIANDERRLYLDIPLLFTGRRTKDNPDVPVRPILLSADS